MKKMPWEEFPHIWKNKTAFMTYLRGCLRKAWSRNPIKHEVIKKRRYKIPNPNPRGRAKTVWGFQCEMCREEFVMSNCQVDHINPAGKLNDVKDIQGFVERLLVVTEDDLRLCCKGCNSALSMSDRYGITYEEAIIRKDIIEFGKNTLTDMNKKFEEIGIGKVRSRAEGKREYEKYIREGL